MIPIIWFIFKHVNQPNKTLFIESSLQLSLWTDNRSSPTSAPGRIWVNFPIKDRDADIRGREFLPAVEVICGSFNPEAPSHI